MTSLRRTESALQVTAAELERFFATSIDLMCIVDLDGRLLKANPAWQATLGHRPDRIEGRSILDLVHPDDRAAVEAEMTDVRRKGRPLDIEYRVVHRDGLVRRVHGTGMFKDDERE
ncbi:MAG: PAS domain-containing protein, partial [Alphaproteobacteria bacterium]